MSENTNSETSAQADTAVNPETDSGAKETDKKCLQRSSSVLSTSSITSSTSSIPVKKSGIRPPSRIGRLCDNQQHKPAVPASPTHDYNVNRLTDNFSRNTRLSDVLEEDSGNYLRFTTVIPYRSRYSSTGSSSSSMDHLWELYPHRLREAGLSRHPDSSAVLTEDTDSFIIGQRVWVGGTKPGTIAFIGETQFAPGDWAGIALDEAIGKNDGSVAGIKYFQCEPKKGVFSRLARLTRVPLEEPHFRSNESVLTPPANGIRSPISPTGSTRSLKSPVSHYASNTSLASTSTTHIIDYKIGDRVIIKSSQGSKVGTVRYIGYTEFAAGEWVGVELDDPRGKNDGSVDGKRYFACQPNFGLFAPINKVSKSPSKVKPGACAIHRPGQTTGLPPSGMRRANSKESMTSITSSVRRKLPLKASTPVITRPSLQDLMKEKQVQIEQLLKERDLERQEFTKAASQAEDAEQQLILIKNEFEAYRAECEVKLQEHMVLLTELKKDRTELLGQLEDEKKKNEDLLFKFEEAAIIKSDLEVLLEKKADEIKELEAVLNIERVRIEEMEKTKLSEADDSLLKANNEIENLKLKLEELSLEKRSFEADVSISNDQIEKLQKELEVTKKHLEELNNVRNDLSQQFTAAKFEHVQTQEKLQQLEQKMDSTLKDSSTKDTEMARIKDALTNYENLNSEYQKQIEELKVVQSNQEKNFSKETEKLKMELSSKNFELETVNEDLKRRIEEIEILNKQSSEHKSTYEAELNRQLIEHQETIAKLNKNLEDLNQVLQNKDLEIIDIKKSTEETTTSLTSQLETISKEILQYQNEVQSLKNELDDSRKIAMSTSNEIQEQLMKQQQESSTKIENLQNNLKKQEEEFLSISEKYNLAQKQIENITGDLEKEKLTNTNHQTSAKSLTDEIATLKSEKQQFELERGDSNRNIESLKQQLEDMEVQKTQMNEQLQSLMNCTGDYSEKLEEMHANLINKQNLLDKMKQEHQEKIQHVERELQEKTLKLEEKESEILNINNELLNCKNVFEQSQTESKNKIHELVKTLQKMKEEHSVKSNGLENEVKEKNILIDQQTKAIKDIEIKMKEQIEKSQSYVNEIIQSYNEKIAALTNEKDKIIADLQTTMEEKLKQKHNSDQEYEEKLKSLSKNEEELKHNVLEISKQKEVIEQELINLRLNSQNKTEEMENLVKTYDEKIKVLTSERNSISEDMQKRIEEECRGNDKSKQEYEENIKHLNENIEKLNNTISENSKQNQELKNDLLSLQSELQIKIKETEDLVITYNEKINTLTEDKNKLTEEIRKISEEKGALKDKTMVEYEEKIKCQNVNIDELKKTILEITKQNEEIKINLSSSQSELQKKIKEVDDLVTSYDKKVDALVQEKTKLQGEIQTQLEGNVQSNTKIKEDYEDKIKSLASTVDQLKNTITEISKQNENLTTDLTASRSELQNKINEICAVSTKKQEEDKIKNDNLEKLKLSIEVSTKKNDELQRSNNEVKVQLEKERNEANILKQQLISVQERRNINNTGAGDMENSRNSNNNEYDYQKLLEDKLNAESQVKFLNSIIVDMQKKNEEQQAKIEILEAGYSPAAAEELNLMGYSAGNRELAPRMYCDICEIFDAHETEDCPQQMSEDMPPPPLPLGKKKEKPPQRPYCELCEMFGHDTQDCPEDDTY